MNEIKIMQNANDKLPTVIKMYMIKEIIIV